VVSLVRTRVSTAAVKMKKFIKIHQKSLKGKKVRNDNEKECSVRVYIPVEQVDKKNHKPMMVIGGKSREGKCSAEACEAQGRRPKWLHYGWRK
jgi:hypothetical protein